MKTGPLSNLYRSVIACDSCPRIVEFRSKVAREKRKQFMDWTYWGKPIPGYGDPNGELLLVGLAPAAHGGNRTARVFTGDKSADFLVNCLHAEGLSNQPNSDSLDDGLELINTFMTPVLKCVPPQDKPTAEELRNCAPFFSKEMDLLKNVKVILALGKIGFDGCIKHFRQEFDLKMKDYPFGHDKHYLLPNGIILWGCYHPSPRNVNTGRMNFEMMIKLIRKIKRTLK
ncbi:MAG: uracil-DNA glycosylase [Candidatus Marinimicrobia bacterium]|nr:uracil-DNA glycosylase [Candidatus Neomarinimicrobiota bacterium]MBL7010475.1 uracil-DNA glycosylase [Candidatus Neomarinimicrobiota bacterium]MBL7030966.1 uracil-DNA glycosylase [Candidatus Neomarinimicrobiota bacterium]